jgi:Tol biopolymer transport system component
LSVIALVVVMVGLGLIEASSGTGADRERAVRPTSHRVATPAAIGRPGDIVFVSSNSGRRELHVLNPGNGRDNPIPQTDTAATPSWSPNRTQIAFFRYVEGNTRLSIIGLRGTDLQAVPTLRFGNLTTSCVCPAWSPDGRSIAYGFGYDGIALRNLRTQRNRVLVCERHECGQEGARGPSWSPDSAWITYWETQYAGLRSVRVGRQRSPFRLPPRCFPDGYPDSYKPADWSPDGRWLLIVTRKAVWKIPVERCRNRKTPRRAKKLAEGEDAVWSPDGTKIAFVSARDGDREIYVMRSDGSHQRRLTTNDWADVEPDW